MQNHLYALYQDSNEERFNEELIYLRKKETDQIEEYFSDLFSILNTIPGITYTGMKYIQEADCSNYIPKKSINIEKSRLELIEATFKLEIDNQVEEKKIYILIPKIVDNFFFIINGNRYFSILQIVDKNFYSVRNGIILKTLLMPLTLKYKAISFDSYAGNTYTGKYFTLDIFKSRNNSNSAKNFLNYFFVEYGVQGTIDKLELSDDLFIIIDTDNVSLDDQDIEYFIVNKNIIVAANKHKLQQDVSFKNIVLNFISVLDQVKRVNSLEVQTFWKKKILQSPTTKLEKADKAIVSLKRILDERTKRNLKDIDPKYRNDTFGVIRYIVENFDEIYNIDSLNLYNRRVRLFEYLIFPLLTKWSESTIRILNSKNVDMKKLNTVFSNIGPMFLVKRIIVNELLRYNNMTNTCCLFNVALKWSSRGPQSIGSSSGNTLVKYRTVHESYIGNLSLCASSASDPGMTGNLSPFCKTLKDNFFIHP
jgi:hypothetical protein